MTRKSAFQFQGSTASYLGVSLLLGAAFALLIVCSSAAFAQQKQEQANNPAGQDECIERGKAVLDRSDLPEAEKIFLECAKANPNSGKAHYWLGIVYFDSQRPEKAIAEFQQMVKLEPNNPTAQAWLGRMYSLDPKKLGIAKEVLERVLDQNPDFDDARFDLARAYVLSGEHDKGVKQFQILFANIRKYGVYYTELARILASANQKDGARRALERALVMDPTNAQAKEMLQSLGTASSPGQVPAPPAATPPSQSTPPAGPPAKGPGKSR